MHGLINRSIQCFLRDTYGAAVWMEIARKAGLGFDNFEPLLTYDASLTESVIEAAAQHLQRSRETVLEDLGTYLISHPNLEALRRLLRFGGVGFLDFLHSLEDLQEHGRLGLPDLEVPEFSLTDQGNGQFLLRVSQLIAGVGHVTVGLLRAMADDYGALVVLDHVGIESGQELVAVLLLDHAYSQGRRFDLALPVG
ncbi:MAG: heme-dependent protein with NO-binding domain [Cypionkella sp.]|uniref:heme NO-binding domain-containing protein n=1 Tax=Cypionkella sp. TaxID=2811411 RepID=UPI00260F8087|nr:heme NO-binding domain-containing protein [Cypionkella sp.]MDB5659495.1 heme-dependent protein with NO-binding domain [Cypionkella sp.]